MTRSSKRRTTSKSGASRTSRKAETSGSTDSSSPTAAPSFVLDGRPPNHQVLRLAELINAARARYRAHQELPEPRLPLYRIRHRNRSSALKLALRRLEEAYEEESGEKPPKHGGNK